MNANETQVVVALKLTNNRGILALLAPMHTVTEVLSHIVTRQQSLDIRPCHLWRAKTQGYGLANQLTESHFRYNNVHWLGKSFARWVVSVLWCFVAAPHWLFAERSTPKSSGGGQFDDFSVQLHIYTTHHPSCRCDNVNVGSSRLFCWAIYNALSVNSGFVHARVCFIEHDYSLSTGCVQQRRRRLTASAANWLRSLQRMQQRIAMHAQRV